MSVEKAFGVYVNGRPLEKFGLLGVVFSKDANAALIALFRWLKSPAAGEYKMNRTAIIEYDNKKITSGGHVFCIEEVEPTPVQSPSQSAAD